MSSPYLIGGLQFLHISRSCIDFFFRNPWSNYQYGRLDRIGVNCSRPAIVVFCIFPSTTATTIAGFRSSIRENVTIIFASNEPVCFSSSRYEAIALFSVAIALPGSGPIICWGKYLISTRPWIAFVLLVLSVCSQQTKVSSIAVFCLARVVGNFRAQSNCGFKQVVIFRGKSTQESWWTR